MSNHWTYWSNRFAHAGLKLELPINHISEAGALHICEQSSLKESITSCLSGKMAKDAVDAGNVFIKMDH